MRLSLSARRHLLATGLVSIMILAGCLPTPGAPAVPPGTRSCTGMPAAKCNEIFTQAEANARARRTTVVGIVVRCTTVCDGQGGQAELTVSYADGTSEQGGIGWQVAAPAPIDQTPAPEPSLPFAPTCVGLDPATCEERALESLRDVGQEVDQVVSIVVRCTPGPCTPASGDGETTLTFADGNVMTIGWGYRSGP